MTARFTSLAVIVLIAGCAAPAPAPKKSAATQPAAATEAPNANTDPCAMRLHDLCGPLLLYFATHGELPARMDELLDVPGFSIGKELTCPVSKKPYRYTRAGLPTKGTVGHVIIYDATPAHDGQRWAIAVKEPAANEPLVAKVILLPDAFFPR